MKLAKRAINSVFEADAVPARNGPAMQQPAAIIRQASQSTNSITPKFLAYIRRAENAQKVGWDPKKNRWFPHADPSGGYNIGYGHHLKSDKEHEYYKKNGATDEEIESMLIHDLMVARQRVHEYIQSRYKVKIPLNVNQEQMLMDYAFNFGGLSKFPKMVDAVLRSDAEKMKAEYKRFANIRGKTRELTGRNTQFASQFFGTSDK